VARLTAPSRYKEVLKSKYEAVAEEQIESSRVIPAKKMSEEELDAFYKRLQAPKPEYKPKEESPKKVPAARQDNLFQRLTADTEKHSLHVEQEEPKNKMMTPHEVAEMERRKQSEQKKRAQTARPRRHSVSITEAAKKKQGLPTSTDKFSARFYEQEKHRQARLEKLRKEKEDREAAECKQWNAGTKKMAPAEREAWLKKRLDHEAQKRNKQDADQLVLPLPINMCSPLDLILTVGAH